MFSSQAQNVLMRISYLCRLVASRISVSADTRNTCNQASSEIRKMEQRITNNERISHQKRGATHYMIRDNHGR
eukprot:5940963-Pleurochrysis_carterae.AAC.2